MPEAAGAPVSVPDRLPSPRARRSPLVGNVAVARRPPAQASPCPVSRARGPDPPLAPLFSAGMPPRIALQDERASWGGWLLLIVFGSAPEPGESGLRGAPEEAREAGPCHARPPGRRGAAVPGAGRVPSCGDTGGRRVSTAAWASPRQHRCGRAHYAGLWDRHASPSSFSGIGITVQRGEYNRV